MAAVSFNSNASIVAVLQQLSELYLKLHDKRRAEAFSKASFAIKQSPYPVTSGKQAMSLPGVGKSTADIVDEYLTTGNVTRLAQLQQSLSNGAGQLPGSVAVTVAGTSSGIVDPEKERILELFQTIHSIGPVSSQRFYNEGYRSLEQLYTNPSLSEPQRLAIYWNNQLNQRIPHAEIEEVEQFMTQRFAPYRMVFNIVGSYRRGASTSGDIDLLVQSQEGLNMTGILYLLQDKLIGKFSEGPTKFMGILKMDDQHNAHQIDIRLVDQAAYPAALMSCTGSMQFNVLMRTQAQSRQLSLSEYGLTSNVMGQPNPVIHSEEDIFRILGVRYLAPHERHDELVSLPLE